ncbi:hypothetical protein B0T24DRAFT_199934 [Lasiosphaeria ovina]|uniref:GMC oxidoreductase n=1 Tax=Lasiosphaeria ovina TaxID=92902 RepID=A0AAE0NFX2_9PEZI|nr:hypothetical protein B0T24DRAFT_199934 [Lasiosphaeria ovina]
MALPRLILSLAVCLAPAQVWAAAVSHATDPCRSASFDYVIVGGGTSGLTLANRLSETPGVTVAVIEAGTFPENVVGNLSAVPAYAGRLEALAETNLSAGWGFRTTPQPGLGGTVAPFVRAKLLGGCSSLNFAAYSRASKGSLQKFADAVGDQSYTWDNVLPYYKKSMLFTPPNSATRFPNATPSYDPAYTARRGPLDVTYPAYGEAWGTWVARGLTAAGLPRAGAFITGTLNGNTFQVLTLNPRTGHRASSDTAFLRPVLSRNNLVLFDGTLAERVLFDSSKTATGVRVSSTKCPAAFTLSARKEVILSAGVIQSPQLLMVSGVGPAATLAQYNITVVADRPGVGQGLVDHILIPLTWKTNLAIPDTASPASVNAFNTAKTGPLTNPGGDFAALEKIPAAFRTNFSASTTATLAALPADWPEVEYLISPFAVSPGATPGQGYSSLFVVLQAPQSVGTVGIVSASIADAPVINPNWLTAQADIDVLLAGFKRIRAFAASPAMAPVVQGEFLPGAQLQTDAQILEYFKLAATSIHHGHATCKMGKPSDPSAVVGPTGKVFGVKNLRVIDSASFPFLLPGPGPQTHIYMLAEKLADAIKSRN